MLLNLIRQLYCNIQISTRLACSLEAEQLQAGQIQPMETNAVVGNVNGIQLSSSASDVYKAFWSYAFIGENNLRVIDLDNHIATLEMRLNEETRQVLIDLANSWGAASSESERRRIIKKLEAL